MLENVEYVEGPDKGAIDALRDEQADCQGRSMLFIALCRANKIPARMVWVDGHAYPEFYLEDAEGKGYWFPCESAGTRAFGEMPLRADDPAKGRQLPRARAAQRTAPLRLGLHDRRAGRQRRASRGRSSSGSRCGIVESHGRELERDECCAKVGHDSKMAACPNVRTVQRRLA